MIRIEWSTDSDLINRTLKEPAIYPFISDDNCPSCDEFDGVHVDGKNIMGCACYYDDIYMGCFLLLEKNDQLVEIHTCLLPKAKGKGYEFGKAVVDKIFSETEFTEITTFIPENNPLAKKLAIKCGFIMTDIVDPLVYNGEEVQTYSYSRWK